MPKYKLSPEERAAEAAKRAEKLIGIRRKSG